MHRMELKDLHLLAGAVGTLPDLGDAPTPGGGKIAVQSCRPTPTETTEQGGDAMPGWIPRFSRKKLSGER